MEKRAGDIIGHLAKKLKRHSFHLAKEERFKISKHAVYRPDLVIRDKANKRIKAIVEIEWRTSRKHMVGGVIEADYCMKKLKAKPLFCLVSLDKKRCNSMRNRIQMLNSYCKNLYSIKVGNLEVISKALADLKD